MGDDGKSGRHRHRAAVRLRDAFGRMDKRLNDAFGEVNEACGRLMNEGLMRPAAK
jgi:hypothetical protein